MIQTQYMEDYSTEVRTALGAVIRDRRKALGLSQGQLGLRLADYLMDPVDQTVISKYELGSRPIDAPTLAALSAVLGFSTDAVLTGMRQDQRTPQEMIRQADRLLEEARRRLRENAQWGEEAPPAP